MPLFLNLFFDCIANILLAHKDNLMILQMFQNPFFYFVPSKLMITLTLCYYSGGEAEIRKHLFFRHIDWDKIANKEVQPPFKPRIRNRLDVSNFDKQFTSQNVGLSPTDESFMLNMDQSMFQGFSYTSESFKYPTTEEDDCIMVHSTRNEQI